ncbi:flagellar motor switch protein FliG [Treponema sp. R8-4-B8]
MNKNKNNQIKNITQEEGFLTNEKRLTSIDYYTVFFKNGNLKIVKKFLKTLRESLQDWGHENEYTVTETSPFKVEIQCSTGGMGMNLSIIGAAQDCSLWILMVCMEQSEANEEGKRITGYSYEELFKRVEYLNKTVTTLHGSEYIFFEDNDTAECKAIAARDEIIKTDVEPIVRMWLARDTEKPVEPDIDEPGYPDYWYSKEYWLKRVRRNGVSIIVAPKKIKTEVLCLEAVRRDDRALEYVPQELKTAELCLEAVRKAGCALEYVPEELKTAEICLEAVRQDGRAFEYVPQELEVAQTCFKIQSIEQLYNKIRDEKPEIIAQILICMQVNKAAGLFQRLNINTQISVIEIISKMEEIDPNQLNYIKTLLINTQNSVIENISKMKEINPNQLLFIKTLLAEKNIFLSNENDPAKGGIDSIISIINFTHRDIFNKIIDKMEGINSDLADEIVKRTSVLEDIVMLSENEVKISLRDADNNDLAKALKGVDSAIVEGIFRKLTKERVVSIKELMKEMGQISDKDVEDAQWKIIKHIRTTLKKERHEPAATYGAVGFTPCF